MDIQYKAKFNSYFDKYYEKYEYIKNVDPQFCFSEERLDVVAKIIYCEYLLGIDNIIFNKMFYYVHLKKLNNFI